MVRLHAQVATLFRLCNFPRIIEERIPPMDSNPIPMFSYFIALKHQNPNQYWLPVTAAQMAKAYIHHGPAYFDLHKDQSL